MNNMNFTDQVEYFSKKCSGYYETHSLQRPLDQFNNWFDIKQLPKVSSYDGIADLGNYGSKNTEDIDDLHHISNIRKVRGLAIAYLVEFWRREGEVKSVTFKELAEMHNHDLEIYNGLFDKAKKDASDELGFNFITRGLNKGKIEERAKENLEADEDTPYNPILEDIYPQDTSGCLRKILLTYENGADTAFIISEPKDENSKITPTRNLLGAILTYDNIETIE